MHNEVEVEIGMTVLQMMLTWLLEHNDLLSQKPLHLIEAQWENTITVGIHC